MHIDIDFNLQCGKHDLRVNEYAHADIGMCVCVCVSSSSAMVLISTNITIISDERLFFFLFSMEINNGVE